MTPLFYPAHDPRAESPSYRRVHHRMVVDENRPCAICGVTNAVVARARGAGVERAAAARRERAAKAHDDDEAPVTVDFPPRNSKWAKTDLNCQPTD